MKVGTREIANHLPTISQRRQPAVSRQPAANDPPAAGQQPAR